MKRGQTDRQKEKQTSQLYDQLGPEGRVGEKAEVALLNIFRIGFPASLLLQLLSFNPQLYTVYTLRG